MYCFLSCVHSLVTLNGSFVLHELSTFFTRGIGMPSNVPLKLLASANNQITLWTLQSRPLWVVLLWSASFHWSLGFFWESLILVFNLQTILWIFTVDSAQRVEFFNIGPGWVLQKIQGRGSGSGRVGV